MDFTKEQLDQKYKSLPPDLRRALDSTEIYEQFQDISKKHNLLIDKAGILEQEVTFVLLGLVPSSKFINQLHEKLDISTSEAQKIASDVNDTIFKSFRESLMRVHSENADIKTVAEASIQEEKIDRDELLREIEKMDGDSSNIAFAQDEVEHKFSVAPQTPMPSQPVVPTKSIIEEKLSGPVKTSTEEVNLSSRDQKNRPDGGIKVDPYREPIE